MGPCHRREHSSMLECRFCREGHYSRGVGVWDHATVENIVPCWSAGSVERAIIVEG